MTSSSDRLSRARESARRAVLRRRRPLAALCAAVAVAAGLSAARQPAAPTTPVVVASHDLTPGTVLTADDLEVVGFGTDTGPSTALSDPGVLTGRVLAAPLSHGEPVTEARLVGPDLVAGLPGLVATPVRLPDPGMVALLRVGDRLDLVAADPQRDAARLVAADVPVLALPDAGDTEAAGPAGALPGRLVVLGLTPEAVPDVTAAALRSFVTYTWADH